MKRALKIGIVLILTLTINSSFFSIPAITKIPGNVAWTNTGFTVGIGDKIDIQALGKISPNSDVKCDPNGVSNRPDLQENNSVLKTSNHGCLIGKIGVDGIPFFVGTNFSMNSDASGELFLGINDTDVKNNSGEYSATISVMHIQNTSTDTTRKM